MVDNMQVAKIVMFMVYQVRCGYFRKLSSVHVLPSSEIDIFTLVVMTCR